MNTEKSTPSIASLWKDLDGLYRLSIPHASRLSSPDALVPEPTKAVYAKQVDEMQKSVQALRAQLFERCAKVYDADGFFSHFEIEIRFTDDQLLLSTTLKDADGHASRYPRCDNVETSREMVAASAFWQWELEQMAKEPEAQ